MRIVVPAHDIARGDTIAESDLIYATVDGNALMSGCRTKMDEVEACRPAACCRAGETFRGDDVRHPIVVTKGQTVTMQFERPAWN